MAGHLLQMHGVQIELDSMTYLLRTHLTRLINVFALTLTRHTFGSHMKFSCRVCFDRFGTIHEFHNHLLQRHGAVLPDNLIQEVTGLVLNSTGTCIEKVPDIKEVKETY